MRVRVKILGNAELSRSVLGSPERVFELPAGATVSTLEQIVGANFHSIGSLAVNGEIAERAHPLKDGDLVELIGRMVGGEGRWFAPRLMVHITEVISCLALSWYATVSS